MLKLLGNTMVLPTDYTKKVTIRGTTEAMQVFRIPLNLLLYNDQNGRIATWTSQYLASGKSFDKNNPEEYNNIISKFIIESDPDAFRNTKKNIKKFGQREPGVVTNYGIVIDGNRRFTCLRELYKETKDSKFEYFEAIILDESYSPKHIKELELQIQHGEEEKVPYNPIDRLVEIYQYIEQEEIFTVKEYAEHSNRLLKDVQKDLEVSKLMVEFLDFFNMSGKYYIARDLTLDGPLREVHNIIKKIKDKDEKERIKALLFENILVRPKGDVTRMVREIEKIRQSNHADEYLEKHEEIATKLHDKISKQKDITPEFIREEIRNEHKELFNEFTSNYNHYLDKINIDKEREKPVTLLKKGKNYIESINIEVLKFIDDRTRNAMVVEIKEIRDIIDNLEAYVNGVQTN